MNALDSILPLPKKNRKWPRTSIIQQDTTLAPIPNNCSLIDLETGAAVVQLKLDKGYQDRPAWRVIYHSMRGEGELKVVLMTWI